MRSKKNRVWDPLAIGAVIAAALTMTIGVVHASRQVPPAPSIFATPETGVTYGSSNAIPATPNLPLGNQPGTEIPPQQAGIRAKPLDSAEELRNSLQTDPEETRQIMLHSMAAAGGTGGAGGAGGAGGVGGAGGAGTVGTAGTGTVGGAGTSAGAGTGALVAGGTAGVAGGVAASNTNSSSDPTPQSPSIPTFP
jgi:hypothetical protein